MEMLKASEVTKWVTRLVTSIVIVMVENAMEAFLATYRLNLVSLRFLSMSSFCLGPLIFMVLFS